MPASRHVRRGIDSIAPNGHSAGLRPGDRRPANQHLANPRPADLRPAISAPRRSLPLRSALRTPSADGVPPPPGPLIIGGRPDPKGLFCRNSRNDPNRARLSSVSRRTGIVPSGAYMQLPSLFLAVGTQLLDVFGLPFIHFPPGAWGPREVEACGPAHRCVVQDGCCSIGTQSNIEFILVDKAVLCFDALVLPKHMRAHFGESSSLATALAIARRLRFGSAACTDSRNCLKG